LAGDRDGERSEIADRFFSDGGGVSQQTKGRRDGTVLAHSQKERGS